MKSLFNFIVVLSGILCFYCFVSIGLVVGEYHLSQTKIITNSTCDVSIGTLKYGFFQLTIFILVIQTIKNTFILFNYICCDDSQISTKSLPIIIPIGLVFYVAQVIGCVYMILKFSNDHSCFKMYREANRHIIVSSFIEMIYILITEMLIIIVGLLTYCMCPRKKQTMNYFDNL